MIEIRKAEKTDHKAIWSIIKEVISTGETFVYDPNATEEEMIECWCGNGINTYVAIFDEKIAGTFYIKNNQPGLGSHVANAGFMVGSAFFGNGIGRKMGEFAICEAKRLGYSAIQYNFVVKANEKAVKLWTSLGFKIIGEVPEAYNHKINGYSSIYIMHRKL